MKYSTHVLAAVILVTISSTAWAGFFLKGARKAKTDPTTIVAKYAIQPCVVIADGSNAGMPGTEYWLFRDGEKHALFERDGRGKGAIIENQWEEEDGRHFFTWVRKSHGWEYVIPHDKTQNGVRLVYLQGTYKTNDDTQGNVRPIGEAVAKCDLQVRTET